MTRKERFDRFIDYHVRNHPEAQTELHYDSPFQLLIAVILSAQCTDKRINLVTPAIFHDFPEPEDLAATDFDTLFPYIKTVSYPNNKTKHLIGMAQMLVKDFNSEVPATIEELVKLPGVGRKTANVIASVIFNMPAMAVDTHVFRVSERLGLTKSAKTPLEAEKQLVKYIPEQFISRAHHWLILHGRYVCLARTPKCGECELKNFCLYYEKIFIKSLK
ncbi:MAG: endonuclease III [Bacteroidia bacterium]|nr:endonuclease III [Bacteroidia bacterium]